jgi:hypothetical protein
VRDSRRQETSEEQAALRSKCRCASTKRLRRPRALGALSGPRSWEEERRREAVRSGLEGDRELSTKLTQVDSFVWGGFTRLAGLRGPVGRGEELRGSTACSSLALGRVRDSEAGVEKALEGTNVQESNGRRSGATSAGANGLGEGATLRSG